jgi:hypothetical protein
MIADKGASGFAGFRERAFQPIRCIASCVPVKVVTLHDLLL